MNKSTLAASAVLGIASMASIFAKPATPANEPSADKTQFAPFGDATEPRMVKERTARERRRIARRKKR